MVAYGASRYALSCGDEEKAEKLWPLIEWCLEYCRRNLNEGGVVASDADELENRFPAGKANLCTSSLYYDALISAGYLGKDLGKPVAAYARQATALKKISTAISAGPSKDSTLINIMKETMSCVLGSAFRSPLESRTGKMQPYKLCSLRACGRKTVC